MKVKIFVGLPEDVEEEVNDWVEKNYDATVHDIRFCLGHVGLTIFGFVLYVED